MHGVMAIRTFRDLNAVNELNAPHCRTTGLGERRCKQQCFAAARRKTRFKLHRYVAAQRGVHRFVEQGTAGNSGGQSSNPIDRLRRSSRPRTAIDCDYRCRLARKLAPADRRSQAAGDERCCAIRRAREVIGEDRYAGLIGAHTSTNNIFPGTNSDNF